MRFIHWKIHSCLNFNWRGARGWPSRYCRLARGNHALNRERRYDSCLQTSTLVWNVSAGANDRRWKSDTFCC